MNIQFWGLGTAAHPLPLLPLASHATLPLVVSCGIHMVYCLGCHPVRKGQ
jgi:hypothetical protein